MSRTKQLAIRINAALDEEIREYAERTRRTLTVVITMALEDFLEKERAKGE